MRARNIKPGFFLNAELSEVCFPSRLLFIGLWCYADKEGRFEWKPKQIKATIFPYDNVNIEKLLKNLLSLNVITCHDGVGYVENFKKHQNPHPHEAKSILPEKPDINQCHDMSLHVTKCNADSLIPDVRIPDVRIPDVRIPDTRNKRFVPPSVEEVHTYMQEIGFHSGDANKWHDFYSSKGWMVGKNKMVNWKSAVRTWQRSDASKIDTSWAEGLGA
jgi:hypothetical protein